MPIAVSQMQRSTFDSTVTSWAPFAVESSGPASHQEVSLRPGDSDFMWGSCQATLLRGWLFDRGYRGCHFRPLKIHSMPLPGEEVQILPFLSWENLSPYKTIVLQIAEFFSYLWRDL